LEEESTSYNEVKRVVTIDLQTGSIFKSDYPAEISGNYAWIYGSIGNKLVFLVYEENETSRTYKYHALSLDDNRITLLHTEIRDSPFNAYVLDSDVPPLYNGKIITLTKEIFRVVDLETEKAVVTATVPQEIQAECYLGRIIIDGKYFFHPWNLGDSYPKGHYVFDMQTGIFTEITLQWISLDKGLSMVMVFAETETEFYVVMGSDIKEISGFGNSGEPITFMWETFIYAMITKEDYYNGIPNYRYINTE